MIGKVHNAKACTFDGRDCWVAAICGDDGHLLFEGGRAMHNVSEHATQAEAVAWLHTEASRRGLPSFRIAVKS